MPFLCIAISFWLAIPISVLNHCRIDPYLNIPVCHGEQEETFDNSDEKYA
jgi:hypothetical protein